MERGLDAARSFLEQLEARGGRERAGLAGEFSDIQARSVSWRADKVYSTEAGSRPENVRKNRYKDVLPYDQTRVTLSLLQEEGHGDYINGSFIRGVDGSHTYIATQGPLPHTLLDFWRLVWEFGVKVILMACRETESGKKKCERYWAQEQEPLQIGHFCITLTREAQLNEDIRIRTLQVTFRKESRSVTHLQYISWPDRGVPSHPEHVLTMVEEARRLQGAGRSPLCVHCSAGCGRTGVLCTLDYVRQLLLTQAILPNFSLFDVVLEMRRQRPTAIQTEEQYRFLYQMVTQMFRAALQNVSPQYQNLKENCAPLYDNTLSLRTPQTLPALPRPSSGEVLRSISVPRPPAPAMADTYAVVQRRGPPGGAGAQAAHGPDRALYSRVAPRASRAPGGADDPGEAGRGRTPGALGPCAQPAPVAPGSAPLCRGRGGSPDHVEAPPGTPEDLPQCGCAPPPPPAGVGFCRNPGFLPGSPTCPPCAPARPLAPPGQGSPSAPGGCSPSDGGVPPPRPRPRPRAPWRCTRAPLAVRRTCPLCTRRFAPRRSSRFSAVPGVCPSAQDGRGPWADGWGSGGTRRLRGCVQPSSRQRARLQLAHREAEGAPGSSCGVDPGVSAVPGLPGPHPTTLSPRLRAGGPARGSGNGSTADDATTDSRWQDHGPGCRDSCAVSEPPG